MATKRIYAQTAVTTLAGTESTISSEAAGDKSITWANVKKYVLENGTIGGTTAGDIADIDSTQTLTNKTLTSPKLNENVAVTALATDLNLLAGAAAAGLTATELLYCKSLSSDAQAQLDAVTPAFGEISVAGGATPQTISTGTYTKLTPFATDGESKNLTTAAATSNLTITTNGVYQLSAQVSFIADTDTWTGNFSIWRDGAKLNNSEVSQYVLTGANSNTVHLSCLVKEGSVSKDYDLRFYHNEGANIKITVVYANLKAIRIST